MVSKLYKYINNKFGKLDNPFWDLLRYIVLGLASVLSTRLGLANVNLILRFYNDAVKMATGRYSSFDSYCFNRSNHFYFVLQ